MQSESAHRPRDIRYEPNEIPPSAITVGLGFQYALLTVAGIVLTPVIVVRAGGGSDAYLSWAVLAAFAVSGLTTILQAVRVGRVGAGYILLMGTSGAFIAVCATALAEGGPAMLATLVVISSLFQFALSARLSLLRRILTPTVAGTVIMLIGVTVMPIIFDMLTDVPEGTAGAAAPVTAATTLAVVAACALRGANAWRLWAPVIGIVVGCAVAATFGLYDIGAVVEAPWIGFVADAWPGFDLSFGPAFWSLLPAFVFVTLVGAIETIGDATAVQRVSWRERRATDYRAVQGAVAADGVGNLLSGLAGTVPNTTYSSSVAVVELTGVAARRVGVCIGALFLGAAFLPKFMAVIIAIPGPVVAAYLTVLLSMLFALGIRMVVQDGIDYRKGIIMGVAFWVGVGFQQQAIFADYFNEFWGGLLQNGMTAGGLTAIVLTLFVELTGARRRSIKTELSTKALPEINAFLTRFASRKSWSDAMTERLCAAAEEVVLALTQQEGDRASRPRRLLLVAQHDQDAAELEFSAATDEANLEDRIAGLDEEPPTAVEHEISLRLLRHFAAAVHHQQYHDTDVVRVRVDPHISG